MREVDRRASAREERRRRDQRTAFNRRFKRALIARALERVKALTNEANHEH